jgi:tetraacyldisaccharide 4'-kinase
MGAEVAVVDGLLQASPVRVADAVLVLDAGAPWGSGRCPPLGDLRAPEEALRAAADVTALVVDGAADGGAGGGGDASARAGAAGEGAIRLRSWIEGGIEASGRRVDVASLRGMRVGLVVGIARPERVVAALARRGIEPSAVVALGDHASFAGVRGGDLGGASVDAWLTTSRCATKLPAAVSGAPVVALDHRIDALPLCAALLARGGGKDASARGRIEGALC